jgi:hypothetical protein
MTPISPTTILDRNPRWHFLEDDGVHPGGFRPKLQITHPAYCLDIWWVAPFPFRFGQPAAKANLLIH